MTPLLRPLTLGLTLLIPGLPVAGAQTALPPLTAPGSPAERAALTRGRALVADFYALRVENLWQAFTADLKGEWGSLDAFRAYRRAGVQQYGAETRVLRERTFTGEGVAYYVRSALFEKDPATLWNVVVGFDARGQVSLFAIVGEEAPPPGPVAHLP